MTSKSVDTEYYYALLSEGKLDLMHLPAGAVAWLWQHDRPQEQVDAAAMVGATAHHMDDPIIDAAILRADKNILVLHTQSGLSINVYPDGGLGSNGEPLQADPMAIQAFLSGDSMMDPGTAMIDPGSDPFIDQAEIMNMGMSGTGLI